MHVGAQPAWRKARTPGTRGASAAADARGTTSDEYDVIGHDSGGSDAEVLPMS